MSHRDIHPGERLFDSTILAPGDTCTHCNCGTDVLTVDRPGPGQRNGQTTLVPGVQEWIYTRTTNLTLIRSSLPYIGPNPTAADPHPQDCLDCARHIRRADGSYSRHDYRQGHVFSNADGSLTLETTPPAAPALTAASGHPLHRDIEPGQRLTPRTWLAIGDVVRIAEDAGPDNAASYMRGRECRIVQHDGDPAYTGDMVHMVRCLNGQGAENWMVNDCAILISSSLPLAPGATVAPPQTGAMTAAQQEAARAHMARLMGIARPAAPLAGGARSAEHGAKSDPQTLMDCFPWASTDTLRHGIQAAAREWATLSHVWSIVPDARHAIVAHVRKAWSAKRRAQAAERQNADSRLAKAAASERGQLRARALYNARSEMGSTGSSQALAFRSLYHRAPTVGSLAFAILNKHDDMNAETDRINGVRNERHRRAWHGPRPGAYAGGETLIPAMAAALKAKRAAIIVSAMVGRGIDRAAARALASLPAASLVRLSSYGDFASIVRSIRSGERGVATIVDRVSYGSMSTADARALVTAAMQEIPTLYAMLKASYLAQHPRVTGRSLRTPRAVALKTGDPLLLLLTDERLPEWTGNRPARLRTPLGSDPGAAAVDGGMLVRSPDHYHSTTRRSYRLDPAKAGVEFEMCFSASHAESNGGRAILAPGGWLIERDSSIEAKEGESSTEVITPPMRWDSLLSATTAWQDRLHAEGWNPKGGETRVCGLHVTSTMPTAACASLRSMLRRMPQRVYQRLSGRMTERSLTFANNRSSSTHGEHDGEKYQPVNVRRCEGGNSLVELRMFTAIYGTTAGTIGRLALARLMFALSNGGADWSTASEATGWLPTNADAILAHADHSAAATAWRSRCAEPAAGQERESA